MRFVTAIPVYNEHKHIEAVLEATRPFSREILVVDDGSTDDTPSLLGKQHDIQILRHEFNQGYGAAIRDAFRYAITHAYDVLVTMDCDGQHEPKRIPALLQAVVDADIVSGSRYLKSFTGDSQPPEDRRRINQLITAELSERIGLKLTDTFCGFKAYRAEALAKLEITEPGYGMPLELWVQAARWGLRIKELPVPLIYLEEHRAFGGALDDADQRLTYYRQVIERAIQQLPRGADSSGQPVEVQVPGEEA